MREILMALMVIVGIVTVLMETGGMLWWMGSPIEHHYILLEQGPKYTL